MNCGELVWGMGVIASAPNRIPDSLDVSRAVDGAIWLEAPLRTAHHRVTVTDFELLRSTVPAFLTGTVVGHFW